MPGLRPPPELRHPIGPGGPRQQRPHHPDRSTSDADSRTDVLVGQVRNPRCPGGRRHRIDTARTYARPTMLTMPDSPTDTPIPTAPILVVDDDAKIVRLVRTYLERDGFSVVTASDGPAALDAIETHQPALVVLDLMLPELDGRAVIRAVRRDEEAAGRRSWSSPPAAPRSTASPAWRTAQTTTCPSHSRRPSSCCA